MSIDYKMTEQTELADSVIYYAGMFVHAHDEGDEDYAFWLDVLATSSDEAIIKKMNAWRKDWASIIAPPKKIDLSSKAD